MTLTKKEKVLLIVLAVMIYTFVFIKFVLLSSIPKIKNVQNRINLAQVQLDALERDYRNSDTYKRQIKETEVIDERLGEYLMSSAGLPDSIEFVESLALLIGAKLKDISLNNPKELVEGNTTYYAFQINFSTVLKEERLNDLLKFCEGGSRKVSVSQLNINPAGEKTILEYGNKSSMDQLYEIKMGIVFYSLDKDSAGSLVKFTRAAFERFLGDNNRPVFIDEYDEKETATETVHVSESGNEPVKNASGGEITLMNADFKIFHRGYLYGGYNFETYSEFNRNERIRNHISVPVDVTLTLGKTQYTIESVDGNGYTGILTGDLPQDRDFSLFIQSNIADGVKENENLWVNLYIRNDSGRKLIISIEQTGDRVKVMDRDGNAINRENNKEKVYL